jgi:hypothetical protein
MKLFLDIALVISVTAWALLKFYFETEYGLVMALTLFGLMVRFALIPALETGKKKECE